MVKQNPKEKLNNKAVKMIDLALDEVFMGGEKSITASFRDMRMSKKIYTLTIGVKVEFEDENSNQEDTDDTNQLPINPSTTNDDGTTIPSLNPEYTYPDDDF